MEENNFNINEPEEKQSYLPMVVSRKKKTLTRSTTNKIFMGVCGGIGEYLDVDSAIIRILFSITILIGGWGVIVYFLASLLIPAKSIPVNNTDENYNKTLLANAKLLIGSTLTLIGFFYIFNIFGVINYFSFIGISPELFGTCLLIFFGIYIYGRKNVVGYSASEESRLFRSNRNRRLSGFCSGLAKYMNTDSNVIRMIWLIFSFLSLGLGGVIYIIAWILVPLEPVDYE